MEGNRRNNQVRTSVKRKIKNEDLQYPHFLLYYSYKQKEFTMATLTEEQLKNAYNNFQHKGYSTEQLSYDQNTNISLGKFRNAMLKVNQNYFDLNQPTIGCVNDFIKKAQKDYYKFAVSFAPRYTTKQEDIETWFRGIIGEIFIVRLLLPNFAVISEKNNKSILNKFLYPTPATNLSGDITSHEFGTDCIALGPNNKICAIQIKFWALFTNQKITYGDVISHLYTDAVCNEYIGPTEPDSMWVFWTGVKNKDVSQWINESPCGKRNMVNYVDRKDIDLTLNGNSNFISLWFGEVALWN